MIIQDIIDGLRANKCPFCNKCLKFSFNDDVCSGCSRISSHYDSRAVYGNYFVWKHNNITYHLNLINCSVGLVKITDPIEYKVYDIIEYGGYHIDEQTDLEDLYKKANQIVKEEIFK